MINQFLTLQKMERQMREMEELRFVGMESLFPFDAMDDCAGPDSVHTEAPDAVTGRTAEQDEIFSGRDRYLWLRKTVRIPASQPGLRPCAVFDFGKTGGGHNSGFESLLYVNRAPYQGVDTNHGEVLFDGIAGEEAELTFLLWTGLEGGGAHKRMEHRFRRAELGYLREDADELYYKAKAIVKTLRFLPEEDPEREGLIGAMEAMLAAINWDAFHDTCGEALAVLGQRLAMLTKDRRVTVSCVGHTHIDVAWLWRLKHTREKALRSFATVLRLMDEFPEYRFIQSQPQLYKYIKTDCPALYEKIRQRVRDGVWEANGGMWLEADCNISSGESLSRQFLYGIRFFQDEFGVTPDCLWLPDVFGYSWALPQIMRQCGIKTFMTTKISWNQYNTMPNDLFYWRGIDGAEVLSYFIHTPEVGYDITARYATYNGQISPRSVLGSWRKFKNKELSNEVLLSFGYGDGGGGPSRNMLRMRRVMDELPGLPSVKPSRAGDFFRRLHERVDSTDRPVPVWDGELYLEYHRGTYTSQARSKRWNRRLEHELAEAEMLACLALSQGAVYPGAELHEGWEILLRNQFHDIIPGSSIHEVYEDSMGEYEAAAGILARVRESSFAALTNPEEHAFTLFSPGSFPAEVLVLLPISGTGSFTMDGKTLPSQPCESGYLVSAALAPLSVATVRFLPGEEHACDAPFVFVPGEHRIETPFYNIRWSTDGVIRSLFDKQHSRHVLREDGFGNLLEVYEDKPIDYENWDIDVFHTQKKETLQLAVPPALLECGCLRAVLRFQFVYRSSRFTQDVILYAKSRRIDFVTNAHWHESHRLLKAAFATGLRSTKATYDVQYGHAERPTHSNTSWDMARFEVVAHKWADLSETGYGVSLLNDCKYGHSVKDGVLRLTLLKSGKFPDTEADMGEHTFTYSLLPHAGSPVEGGAIEEAILLNQPVRVTPGAAKALPPLLSGGDGAFIVDAVKHAEDGSGLILRLHECRGGTHSVTLEAGFPVSRIEACNILEEPTGAVYAPESWTFTLRPFEIKNFRLTNEPL